MLGPEITASLGRCSLFWCCLCLFPHKSAIPGEGIKRITVRVCNCADWLFAMLVGVPYLAIHYTRICVGLSDAIPVFIMGILLSLLKAEKGEKCCNTVNYPLTEDESLVMFTGTFLMAKYCISHRGNSIGIQTSPFYTFLWTLLMGACIGIVCILLGISEIRSY